MTPNAWAPSSELERLADDACRGSLDEQGAARLAHLLHDRQACEWYRDYCLLNVELRFLAMADRVDAMACDRVFSNMETASSQPPPIIIDSSPTLHSPLFTLHSPVGSFVFSHIAAAVILGIGLLIGLAWRISLPSSEGPVPNTIARSVAHITALADCKWTKQGSEVRGPGSGISEIQIPKSPNPQIPVFLGDRFSVSSGFMQITYDTGAVVLLQGPCTYEIDSFRGGYLAVGKLTAKVEKGSGVRGPGAGNANHSPLSSLPSPLFAVRTPTAVVTDLGTEFGVEVEESGATRSHVFQGSVAIVLSPDKKGIRGDGENSQSLATSRKPAEILHAGEAVRIERGRNRKVAITREPGQPNRFIRQIPSCFTTHPSSLSKSPQTSGPRPQTPLYRITDLGTFGGQASEAVGINSAGQVVGGAMTVNGARHAFLYTNGKMRDLGALHYGNSGAIDINASGQVVGGLGTQPGPGSVFLYTDGTMIDLEALRKAKGMATAINDAGMLVGSYLNPQGVRRAFLYTRHQGLIDLGALGGDKATSYAIDLNDAGQVVGVSETKDGSMHAFLYGQNTGMKDLGTLKGHDGSMACCINNAGLLVGVSAVGTRPTASSLVLYDSKEGMRAFCDCSEFKPLSPTIKINNRGQIICRLEGKVQGKPVGLTFLYYRGVLTELKSSVVSPAGWTNLDTAAINDSGHIVGTGRAPDGNMRAFLLTPIKGQVVGD